MTYPSKTDIENLYLDCIHVAEIATGREGGTAGGAIIDTSYDRLNVAKTTIPAAIAEIQGSTQQIIDTAQAAADTAVAAAAAAESAVDLLVASPTVGSISVLTQAQYDAIPTKDPETLYIIQG